MEDIKRFFESLTDDIEAFEIDDFEVMNQNEADDYLHDLDDFDSMVFED